MASLKYVFSLSAIVFITLFPLFGAKKAKRQDAALFRAPFVLEFPELNGLRLSKLALSLPNVKIRTLKFHILKPFDEQIPANKIFTKLNGEAITTLCQIGPTREGTAVTCDLELKPGFQIGKGKNVVEIIAESRPDRRTRKTEKFYASYVLLLGAGNAAVLQESESRIINATLEKIPVVTGTDKTSPEILLNVAATSLRVGNTKLSGTVADGESQIESFTIDGKNVVLTEAKGTRDLVLADENDEQTVQARFVYNFAQPVALAARPVLLEAKDKAGNITRLTIPVREAESRVTGGFTGRKYALITGISKYKYPGDGLKDLQFADRDAQAIREFLKSPQGGAFPDANIRFLTNEGATLEGFREAMSFLRQATKDDLVIIFLAGHGAPDPFDPQNLYYLMHDTKIAEMDKTALGMKELREFLNGEVRAERTLVFVDTCHSAGLSGKSFAAKRSSVSQTNLINLYTSKLFNEKGRAVLTSSDVDEISFESEKWGGGHGVFTFSLLEGLRGKADSNADKFVTAGEIFNYVTDRVAQETKFRQNPRPLLGSNRNLTISIVSGKQ